MKALIVDDERLARLELRRLLVEHPEIEVAGEARNGEEALSMISQLAPDLLFLDIQMPGMTGFELLERLEELPQVIFTTAYNEYAIKAFEVNALDYLLKPIVPARLAAALTRVRPLRIGDGSNRYSCATASAAGSSGSPTSSCSNPKAITLASISERSARSSAGP